MAGVKLGDPYPTFEAWDKATGQKIVVDDRTFNPELHSKTPPSKSKEK